MIDAGLYILTNAGTGYLTLIAFLTCSAVMIVQCYEAGLKK
jgi:hypothetical protein